MIFGDRLGNGRGIVVFVGAALAAGCTQMQPRDTEHFKVEDQDFALIAEASLKIIERNKPVTTLILPAGLDRRAVAALRKSRPILKRDEVPTTSELALPEGDLIVEVFTIDDGIAAFEGELGPITRAAEGKNLPGCGLRFALQFYWEKQGWASHSYKILDCATIRVWTPVD